MNNQKDPVEQLQKFSSALLVCVDTLEQSIFYNLFSELLSLFTYTESCGWLKAWSAEDACTKAPQMHAL